MILDHASRHPDNEKAFLSGDVKAFGQGTDAWDALDEAGVKYFKDALSARGWLGLYQARKTGLDTKSQSVDESESPSE